MILLASRVAASVYKVVGIIETVVAEVSSSRLSVAVAVAVAAIIKRIIQSHPYEI